MKKHTNRFIDGLNKGDKVFFVAYPRGKGDVWIGEVEFQSQKLETERYLYQEPRITPFYDTDYYYTVKFKDGRNSFSVRFKDHSWCSEDDLTATNIDLEKAPGLLMGGYYVADCYMTTNKGKFQDFLKRENLLETAIVALEKQKSEIEKQLKKLFGFRSLTLAQ